MWKAIRAGGMKHSFRFTVLGFKFTHANLALQRTPLKMAIPTAIFLLTSVSCLTTYSVYSQNMFAGQNLLNQGEYEAAKRHFEGAAETQQDLVPLTFLAIVDYKTGNMNGAEKLMREAEKMSPENLYYLRTIGYKSLILLKANNMKDGLQALKDYVDLYRRLNPLTTIEDVRIMWEKQKVDMTALESLIEYQVSWYENELIQYYTTGTGYYDRSHVDL